MGTARMTVYSEGKVKSFYKLASQVERRKLQKSKKHWAFDSKGQKTGADGKFYHRRWPGHDLWLGQRCLSTGSSAMVNSGAAGSLRSMRLVCPCKLLGHHKSKDVILHRTPAAGPSAKQSNSVSPGAGQPDIMYLLMWHRKYTHHLRCQKMMSFSLIMTQRIQNVGHIRGLFKHSQ